MCYPLKVLKLTSSNLIWFGVSFKNYLIKLQFSHSLENYQIVACQLFQYLSSIYSTDGKNILWIFNDF